jgi:streptogramin lyase
MTALPPDAQRYLTRMRSLDPPVELVDSIMAEVEATPQVRSGPDLRAISDFVLAAAAVLAIAVLLRVGTPNVGPAPTPVALDQLPSAGRVEARISVDASDVPAAFGHGFLWLTNAASGELVRMDPANGSIYSPLVVTEPGSAVPIAITDSAVWVVDRRDGTLVELDPDAMEERRRIPVEGTIAALAADGNDLWLLDVQAGRLARMDSADGSTAPSVVTEGASSLLVHAGAVWVGSETGAVTRIDPASGDETGRVDVGTPVGRLLADGDAVFVVGEPGEPIVRVDIGSMEVAARGTEVLTAAAEGGRVWGVASGHLVRLDPQTLQPVAAHLLELDAAGTLATGGGSLWTTGLDEVGDTYLLEVAPTP